MIFARNGVTKPKTKLMGHHVHHDVRRWGTTPIDPHSRIVATHTTSDIATFTHLPTITKLPGCVTNCSDTPTSLYSGAKVVYRYVPFLDCGLPYVHFAIFVTRFWGYPPKMGQKPRFCPFYYYRILESHILLKSTCQPQPM